MCFSVCQDMLGRVGASVGEAAQGRDQDGLRELRPRLDEFL
jgi:hypothetical protein